MIKINWLKPNCFSKLENGEWTPGIDPFLLRGVKSGFTNKAKEAAPSLAKLEKMGPFFLLSEKTGQKRPDGSNVRRFRGGAIVVTFLNPNGEATKEILKQIREESPEVGEYLALGAELIQEGLLSEEDFKSRNWNPAQVIFLLQNAGTTPNDWTLWYHSRIQSFSAELPF